MADDVDVVVENVQLDLVAATRQEADGVERELELGTCAQERASNRLRVALLPDELCRHNAWRAVVRLQNN